MQQDATFWQGRRVAVTGATGFIGHHTVDLLRQLGANVTALVRGTSSVARLTEAGVRCVTAPLDDIAALTAGCNGADVLLHIAGAVDFGDDWELCRRVNVDGTRNVLEAARRAGIRRVVHVSSIVAVGANPRPLPFDERADWNLDRLRVAYITTKREGEAVALESAAAGQPVVVVNPGCVIGPEDVSGSEFGVLCRRFWRRRIPFYFAGGLSAVDVRDVAGGVLRAAERGESGSRYLLTGHNLTQGQFFAALARTADRFFPRLRLPVAVGRLGASLADRVASRPGHRPYLSAGQARALGLYFWYDCTRARRHFGYEPRPLADTLADTHRFWTRRRAG